ncbi:ParB/RepB/Spo0J family partition protein [Streptomyces lavendulae]|uniref:ParB/RepB/Spo0J family partition protein n=1 Tax=Streptomyces lavendulae TaxID=1914 RepID=UPI00371F24C6
MSKSDLLGTGAAFNNARRAGGRSERGRAKAIAQGDVPSYELIRLPLDQVSPSPLNPRRNFGTDEDKTRFGEELRQAQLSACVVTTRSAYLALWPDHASRIGSATHVLINGERRFRSALHVGLESLDFVVRDDLAASRTDFIDHLLAENLEREDFDVIERARGVQQLVESCADEGREHGAKSRAAERLGRSPSWVTNQLVLLELPKEIQLKLSSGELPERDGRLLARAAKDRPGVDADELLGFLQQNKQQEAELKAAQREILRNAQEPVAAHSGGVPQSPEPATEPTRLLSADKSRDPEAPPPAPTEPSAPAAETVREAPLPKAVLPSAPAPAPELVQVQESEPAGEREAESVIPSQTRAAETPSVMWQDPKAMYEAIWANMSPKHRAELTMLLIENNRRG